MENEIIISYLLIYILEALILWLYSSNMFIPKYAGWITCISAICIYALPFLTVFQENIWINVFLFFLVNFVYIKIFYNTKWFIAIFHAIITTIFMSLSELFIAGLLFNLAYEFYAASYQFHNFVILTVLSKLLYFIILELIIFFFKQSKKLSQIYNLGICILTIVPIISAFIVLTFTSISVDTKLNPSHNYKIAISTFLLLIINIIVFGIYNYNQKKSQEFTELQLQVQHEYDFSEYYKMLVQQHEDQSILIHDTKKHLNAITLLIEQKNYAEAQNYINRIISSDLRSSIRVSDNELLNALLGRYLRLCQDKHISFKLDIRTGVVNFMDENDLTALFGNLLDNAVESAEKQQSSFIELNVCKKEHTPFTLLTMTNSCRTDPFSPKNGTLITHKKDKLRHGYGIKSIKRIIKKYKGDIQMYYDKETTTFHTIITLKSESIDN